MSRSSRPRCGRSAAIASLFVAVLALAGCDGNQAPAEPTSARDRSAERFWDAFRAASAARGAGDLERAADLYEEALALDPEHGDSLYYLGHFRYGRGEIDQARQYFERLAAVQPVRLRSWQQLSLLRGQPRPGWAADLDAARVAARRAVDLVRDESLNFELLARWAAYRGDPDTARAHLATALGHNPDSSSVRELEAWLDRSAPAQAADDAVRQLTEGSSPPRRLDLNADGDADLLVIEMAGGSPVLARVGSGRLEVLPSARPVLAWEAGAGAGPFPVPARAAVLRGTRRERVVLVGGGSRGARLYELADELYSEVDAALPAPAGAPLVTAGDLDGDGIDDLVLANVRLDDDSQRLGGRVYRGGADGQFRPTETVIAGPLDQVLATDLDADGDDDLVVARRERQMLAEAATGDHAPPATAAVRTRVEVFINDRGTLRGGDAELPLVDGRVLDLVVADLDADGRPDLFLVTGDGLPESGCAFALWIGTGTGFVEASPRFDQDSAGTTVRVWPADGGVLLLRGGTVPGDPRHVEWARVR